MSDLRVRSIGEEELGTIIDTDVEFEGEMEFGHPVLIHGFVKGSISSSNDVFIGEEAKVTAKIHAHRVSIKGFVDSAIEAEERVELFKSARMRGSITTPDLIVQSGARFTGPCVMPMDGDEKKDGHHG